MARSQRGLGSFGVLVVLAIAIAGGYYAYQAIWSEPAPSCGGAFTACMQKCRRTTTENAAAQACQQACQGDQAACERPGR